MKPDAKSRPLLELYLKLDKAGFDQVPCASNWCSSDRRKAGVKNDECMANMVKFCRANLSPAHLKGFLMGVKKKLSNEKFVANAPEAVVAMERKKEHDAEEKIAALKDSIAELQKKQS
jgi:valyl-tRNA synthetase